MFCGIARGDVEASIVRADDLTVAFMDASQSGPGGHVLVVPRVHVPDLFSLDDDLGAALMRMLLRVARAVRATFSPDGMNVFHSTGAVAGQEVAHLHFHVQPRWRDDGMFRVYSNASERPRAELEDTARRIKAAL